MSQDKSIQRADMLIPIRETVRRGVLLGLMGGLTADEIRLSTEEGIEIYLAQYNSENSEGDKSPNDAIGFDSFGRVRVWGEAALLEKDGIVLTIVGDATGSEKYAKIVNGQLKVLGTKPI